MISRMLQRVWGSLYWTLTLVGATYCAFVLLGIVPFDGVAPYRYAPAFLIPFAPLRLLPWDAFAVVWFGSSRCPPDPARSSGSEYAGDGECVDGERTRQAERHCQGVYGRPARAGAMSR